MNRRVNQNLNPEDQFYLSNTDPRSLKTNKLNADQLSNRTSFLDFVKSYFNSFIGQRIAKPVDTKPDSKTTLSRNNLADIQALIGENCDYSFDESDLPYVKKLNELITRENQMILQIQELEAREQSYKEILRRADDKWSKTENYYKRLLFDNAQKSDRERLKFESLGQDLVVENLKLQNEVNSIKVELSNCMKNIEEPIYKELEKENVKSERLQRAINAHSEDVTKRQFMYKQGMSDFGEKLKRTCDSLHKVTSSNELLQKEMIAMKSRYEMLQEDLTSQKMSETRTLKQLEDVRSRSSNYSFK